MKGKILKELTEAVKTPYEKSIERNITFVFNTYDTFYEKHKRQEENGSGFYLRKQEHDNFVEVLKIALEKLAPTPFC